MPTGVLWSAGGGGVPVGARATLRALWRGPSDENVRLSPTATSTSQRPMMTEPKQIDLLIVDDDDDFRQTLVSRFVRHGFRVQEAADAEQALGLAQRREFDVAVFDVMMPGVSGLQLLEQYKKCHADCEVIMLTGQGTIQTAVEAMKLGAYDYLTKPFPMKGLESLIEKAYERRRLKKENLQLRALLRRTSRKT